MGSLPGEFPSKGDYLWNSIPVRFNPFSFYVLSVLLVSGPIPRPLNFFLVFPPRSSVNYLVVQPQRGLIVSEREILLLRTKPGVFPPSPFQFPSEEGFLFFAVSRATTGMGLPATLLLIGALHFSCKR